MTILGPLIFGGLIVGIALIAANDDTHHHILVADEMGNLIEDEVIDFEKAGIERPRFRNSAKITFDFRKGTVNPDEELKTGIYTGVVQLSAISYTDGKVDCLRRKRQA